MQQFEITLTKNEMDTLRNILTDMKYDVQGEIPEPEMLDTLIRKMSGNLF
jgi:hypothetical protein